MTARYALLNGDCLEELKTFPDNSLDSLVTDPPAGISFMGKEWDDDKGGRKQWIAWMTGVMKECHRVLKPGAHGLVWAIPRTSHWTATALEDAGFEVRDVVTHLFGTGFPKSMDISKAIDKAAGAEREVIGPDPYAKNHPNPRGSSVGQNYGNDKNPARDITAPATDAAKQWAGWGTALKPASEHWILIRKPCSEKTVAANVLKWGVGGLNIDGSRIPGNVPSTTQGQSIRQGEVYGADQRQQKVFNPDPAGRFPANLVLDEEAAAALDEQTGANNSRFFYVAKASKSDKGADNTHPTVKSTALMSYLIKLITPPNGIVLDPFAGSGSTGVSALKEGFQFLGIEKHPEYYETASKRLADTSHNDKEVA